MEEPEPELHKAILIWIRMQFDSSPGWNRLKLNGIQWWVLLRVRLQIWFRSWLLVWLSDLLSVSLCYYCVYAAIGGMWRNADWNPEYDRGKWYTNPKVMCKRKRGREICCNLLLHINEQNRHKQNILYMSVWVYHEQKLTFINYTLKSNSGDLLPPLN